jgi:hypothetical protein
MGILTQQIGGVIHHSRLHVANQTALKNAEVRFSQLGDRFDTDAMVAGDFTCGVHCPREIAGIASNDWEACQVPADIVRLSNPGRVQWDIELSLNPAWL